MEGSQFESYRRLNDHDEIDEWLQKLLIKDRAKMLQVITDTQGQGLLIVQRIRWVKKLKVKKSLRT